MSKNAQRSKTQIQRGRPESTAAIIERVWAEPIEIMQDGRKSTITTLEAIGLKFFQKSAAEKVKASRVLLEIEQLIGDGADQGITIEFADDE